MKIPVYMMRTYICLFAIGSAALAASAQGSTEAMLNYAATTPSDGNPVYSSVFSEINGPIGWTFQPVDNLEVTALGAFNYLVPGTGSLEVGLWNSSGVLLASETITDGNTLVDQSRYQTITAVPLEAGDTYYLAAYDPAGTPSAIVVTPGSAPNGYATMSEKIQLGEVAYSSGAGFEFPGTTDGTIGDAIIAPNFEYETVPEPSAPALLGGASVALLWHRRRSVKVLWRL
jgi:hypothetical protein